MNNCCDSLDRVKRAVCCLLQHLTPNVALPKAVLNCATMLDFSKHSPHLSLPIRTYEYIHSPLIANTQPCAGFRATDHRVPNQEAELFHRPPNVPINYKRLLHKSSSIRLVTGINSYKKNILESRHSATRRGAPASLRRSALL